MNAEFEPSSEQIKTFSLSMLSNISSNYTISDSKQKSINDWTKDKTKEILNAPETIELIGEWDLVWGPQVVTGIDPYVARNSMFMVWCKSLNKYVVAIAGTNPKSIYDWFFEDSHVEESNMIEWRSVIGKPKSDDSGKISNGTDTGLNALLGMKDADNGKTILESISKLLEDGEKEIEVTGHSLGGALAPTLALYLKDKLTASSSNKISCLATAGATPGDDKFADYFNVNMSRNSIRIWNKYDVVPHAWEKRMLSQIPNIYDDFGIKRDKKIQTAVRLALAISSRGNYTQLQYGGTPFDSSFIKKTKEPTTFEFEMGKQHVCAYIEFFGIHDFYEIMGVYAPSDKSHCLKLD